LFTTGIGNSAFVGVYSVSVALVIINGKYYSTFKDTLQWPKSFQLNVLAVSPSLTATITPSTVAGFSLAVLTASAAYSQFDDFTYVDASGVTTSCGAFTYSVALALGNATNMLSTFTLNSAARSFQA